MENNKQRMRKYILGVLLMISTLTTYAQDLTSLGMKLYVNGISPTGGQVGDAINSGQPFIFSVDVTNYGRFGLEETDTMWFRYFFDNRWYRPNGKLNQNYPIYEKPITRKIIWGETVKIQLDTIYMEDSLLTMRPDFTVNLHRTGVALVRCKKADLLPDFYQEYWFLFNVDSSKLGVNDLILTRKEPKLVATYDILGRPVQNIEPNVPYIFLYDNGQRKKIILEGKP